VNATTVAIDLAKDVFQLTFADAAHRVVDRQRLKRAAFSRALENRAPLRVVMEACGAAHYWARRFQRLGHTVVLLPARQGKPYVLRRKTDRTDADGLLEADRCGRLRAVPVKPAEQQGVQSSTRRLGRVTKCGDTYLRMLLVHGARAALRSAALARKRDKPLDRTRPGRWR